MAWNPRVRCVAVVILLGGAVLWGTGCKSDPTAGPLDAASSSDAVPDRAAVDLPRPDAPAPDSRSPDLIPNPDGPSPDLVKPPALVMTVAGDPAVSGHQDGPAKSARFNSPLGLAVDTKGRVFVADTYNHRIRMIAGGQVTTVAGKAYLGPQPGAFVTAGSATQIELWYPTHIAAINDDIYFSDWFTCIRKLSTTGHLSTVVGSDQPGQTVGNSASTRFAAVSGLFLVGSHLVVYDRARKGLGLNDYRLVTIDPVTTTATNWVVTGPNAYNHLYDCQKLNLYNVDCFPIARLDLRKDVAEMVTGYLVLGKTTLLHYTSNDMVRLLSAVSGPYGSGPPHGKLKLLGVSGMAVHPASGKLFVAEYSNQIIRIIDPATGAAGLAAGIFQSGTTATDGFATASMLGMVRELAYDAKNNILYFINGHSVRAVTHPM